MENRKGTQGMQQRMIATHHFLVAKMFYSQPKWSIDRTKAIVKMTMITVVDIKQTFFLLSFS
jgi:hypothetical protein